MPIPDNPTVQSRITVAPSIVIGDLDVRVNINHTWDTDLDIALVPPWGTEYLHLCSDVGGSGDNFTNTVFDQDASIAINLSAAPFNGRFLPEGGPINWVGSIALPPVAMANLDGVNGRSTQGDWTLLIDDDAAGVTGTLTEWALLVTAGGGPTPPTGIATLSPAAGAPGAAVLATVVVTPGTNPASSGLSVNADASEIDAGSIPLRDDGVAPDSVAGDNAFNGLITVGPLAVTGPRQVRFTVADQQGRSTEGGTQFAVRNRAAPNDACGGAEVIPSGFFPYESSPVFVSGNAAAVEAGLVCSQGGATNANSSVWYRFQPTLDGLYRLSTSENLATGNTLADTVLAVYDGTPGGCAALTALACDDDSGVPSNGSDLQSDLTVQLTAGRVYFIQIAKWGGIRPTDSDTTAIFVDLIIPAGACCLGEGCEVLARADCESRGGAYLGDGVVCREPSTYQMGPIASAFEDISETGASVPASDDSFAPVPLGFEFGFFDVPQSGAFMSSNGFLSFGVGSASLANSPIPSPTIPNNAIYALWDDLNPDAGGTLKYETRGEGQELRFIAQWTGVPQFGQNDANTFQIVIFQNGNIELRYQTVSAFSDADATVGVENADGDLAYSVNGSAVQPNVAFGVRLIQGTSNCASPACPWAGDGCFADYNNDGNGIDGDDVIAFFADWDGALGCADIDQANGVDADDVIAFFTAWDQSGAGFPGC
ncbi:MAG: hypothetical protein ACOYN0_00010 [Phycisphaerales bacterium]